jgi:hypothetical protein
MKSLLQKLLKRKGIETLEELSTDERVVFDNYNKVLSKETLTIDDLRKFLEIQVSVIEGKWRDHENTRKAELIPYHTCYKVLLQAIDAPQAERKALEDYLNQQLES